MFIVNSHKLQDLSQTRDRNDLYILLRIKYLPIVADIVKTKLFRNGSTEVEAGKDVYLRIG